ncbi:energy transducer TonB [Sulfuricystis multivorans]|uniref:energy transducer TonB n=1 Tax=Sulfuricystis multivorans TaxID=2211108 RepID=UPI0015583914|nr:energy transducer TonB [Sulfuricystis multivorans]
MMAATIGCRDSAGGRMGLALLISLVLHGVLLFPWRAPRMPRPVSALEVTLPPLAMPEPVAQLMSAAPEATQDAIVPASAKAAVAPAPTVGPVKPQPLKGRALSAALAALTQEEFYPRAAIEQGLEGRVVLLLTLDEGGRVTRIELASSSGHALLDEAAVQAASRVGRLAGGHRQVLLPVEFRLE